MKIRMLAVALVMAMASPASAVVVSLNFEGINPVYPSTDYAQVLDYYNGGTSSAGTSGTNFGVSFSSNALAVCLNTPGATCSNASRGGQGDVASARTALFFLTGAQTYLNYAAGFTDGFSFNYSAVNQGGSVGVYDGLNGTGNLLATLTLATTTSGCSSDYGAGFCPFVAKGVTFAGTARSIGFGGTVNQIAFDDVTFGSAIPGPVPTVPEPAVWLSMITGFGLIGGAVRHRREPPMTASA